ncbi:MAG: accessory gene regulator ArgB-like protein [Lachnospiraceae bacterium]
MIERFAAYLSNVLIHIGTTREEERPFLTYGLFCLMSDTIQLGLLLVISLLSNTVVQMAMFTFFFGILKRTIGGWHASHHITCLALFTTLTTACIYIGQLLDQSWILPLTLMFAAIMWVIVWCRAPVEHPNNPQTPARLAELKRISRGIAGIELICIIIPAVLFSNTAFSRCLLIAAMGSFCAAIALIPQLPLSPEKGGDGLD